MTRCRGREDKDIQRPRNEHHSKGGNNGQGLPLQPDARQTTAFDRETRVDQATGPTRPQTVGSPNRESRRSSLEWNRAQGQTGRCT